MRTTPKKKLEQVWRRISVLTIIILGTSCHSAQSTVVVTSSEPKALISPSASDIRVDDTLQVDLIVQNIANLIAFEAHLSFDRNKLEVQEIKDGGFVMADLVVQNSFDNTTGTIDYAITQLGRQTVSGNGTLMEIIFRAKSQGEAAIFFQKTQTAPLGLLLADPDGVEIKVSLINGNVNIHGN